MPTLSSAKIRTSSVSVVICWNSSTPTTSESAWAAETVAESTKLAVSESAVEVDANALSVTDRGSEEHTSGLQSRGKLVCRLVVGKKDDECFEEDDDNLVEDENHDEHQDEE